MPSLTSSPRWDGVPPARHGAWPGAAGDPFAVNPIRRSFAVVAISAATVFVPVLIGGPAGTALMLGVGWAGILGLTMGTPVLLWSLIEVGWRRLRRRLHPTVEDLDLSPRLQHVLRRHGYDTIGAVERTPDATLLLLSNMDARGLHEVRRAINLWHYRHWQERGFP